MLHDVLFLVLGLITLIVAGEFLVKGAVGIAKKLHLSTLVIGMTVVSFGTSAPELIVSVQAALEGVPDIAVGNVVGSNIANIALVLAITVLIFPITVDRNTKVIDWPMMIFATGLFYLFALDNVIVMWEGIVLFTLLIAFIAFIIRKSVKENKKAKKIEEENQSIIDYEPDENAIGTPKSLLFLFLGLVGLKFGADWLLDGAVGMAQKFGMSEKVIGVTIIAFGTSVPELVASGVAAYRKETDISIGNLIGSNIFNIMAVIAISSIITPIKVDQSIMDFDMLWMIGIALILLPMMLLTKKMGRISGIILLGAYITYIYLSVASLI